MATSDADCHYNAQKHTYWHGDRRLLSVTEVLDLAGVRDNRWHSEEVAERGTYVHVATAMNDRGEWNPDDKAGCYSDWMRPYGKAWQRFLAENNCQILGIEERVYAPTLGLAGTVDRRMTINAEGPFLIDIKSGGPERWHPLQTAGYALCYDMLVARACVYLKPDGKYMFELHKDRQDYDVFKNCLGVVQWLKAA